MGWFIAKKPARLGDICEAMADVARTERAVDGFGAFKMRMARREQPADFGVKIVEARALADRDIVDLIRRVRIVGRRREQIRLHGVGDVTKVAGRLAIAVDGDFATFDHRRRPSGNHRRIRPVRVLSGAKHVEIAKPNCVDSVSKRKSPSIELVDAFRDRIGAQRFAYGLLSNFGSPG